MRRTTKFILSLPNGTLVSPELLADYFDVGESAVRLMTSSADLPTNTFRVTAYDGTISVNIKSLSKLALRIRFIQKHTNAIIAINPHEIYAAFPKAFRSVAGVMRSLAVFHADMVGDLLGYYYIIPASMDIDCTKEIDIKQVAFLEYSPAKIKSRTAISYRLYNYAFLPSYLFEYAPKEIPCQL